MDSKIFRKKSLDRISSPDQLNDYIKVSNPSVWLIIGALIIIVITFSLWALNGNITTEVPATGVFKSKNSDNTVDFVVSFVDEFYSKKIAQGMPVRIYDNSKNSEAYLEGIVAKVENKVVSKEDVVKSLSESVTDNIMNNQSGVPVLISLNKTSEGNYIWANNKKDDESFINSDGLCKIEIVTESITPIEFLINQSK